MPIKKNCLIKIIMFLLKENRQDEKNLVRKGECEMFFGDFDSLKQIVIMATLFYFTIIAILRISGKRTLSELNTFDFVVTVTIGSIASSTILSDDTTFVDGFAAIATIVILQFIVSKADVHFKFVGKALKSDPTLVYYDGEYLEENMRKMRLTKEDILQEVRVQSQSLLEDIEAVILESNGKISVISSVEDASKKELETYK